jgi:hypothetical protein
VPESNIPSTQRAWTVQPAPGATGPQRPAKPPLRVGRLLSRAARVARGDPWRILAVSIVLSSVSVIAESLADLAVDEHSVWQVILAAVLTEGVGLLGTVLLSGFLCRLTGQGGPGRPRVTLGHVIRTLPWGRLVLADLAVTALTIAGFLALVVPGFIIVTLLAITGPLIDIEDHSARAALRRSRRLVRHYFWRVVVLATIPIFALSELESAAPEPHHPAEFLEALAIRGVADGLFEAAVGLVLVQLCYRLIAVEDGAAAAKRASSRRRRAGAA